MPASLLSAVTQALRSLKSSLQPQAIMGRHCCKHRSKQDERLLFRQCAEVYKPASSKSCTTCSSSSNSSRSRSTSSCDTADTMLYDSEPSCEVSIPSDMSTEASDTSDTWECEPRKKCERRRSRKCSSEYVPVRVCIRTDGCKCGGDGGGSEVCVSTHCKARKHCRRKSKSRRKCVEHCSDDLEEDFRFKCGVQMKRKHKC